MVAKYYNIGVVFCARLQNNSRCLKYKILFVLQKTPLSDKIYKRCVMLENKIAKMPLSNWGGLSFKCHCGTRHEISVKEIVIRDDVGALIPYFAKKMGRVAQVVYDECVYHEAREKVAQKMNKSFDVTECLLHGSNTLTKDYCDKLLSQANEATKVIICVGGANANEYGKYASAKLGCQWIFINILPNGDNFASNYSMLWDGGVKQMFKGHAPDVILCDLDLAYRLSAEKTDEAFALILRNLGIVFDNNFASIVQGSRSCSVINFIITNAVKDAVNHSQKPYGKGLVKELFSCLLRISLAKNMAKVNMEYLTSMHSMIYALQSRYNNYSEGVLSVAVADTLAKVYQVVLNADSRLVPDKDRYGHTRIIKQVFGLDIESSYGWTNDDEGYAANKKDFAKNAEVMSKVARLAKKLVKTRPVWDADFATACLQVASDIYAYNGLLAYANEKGLFDTQEPKTVEVNDGEQQDEAEAIAAQTSAE